MTTTPRGSPPRLPLTREDLDSLDALKASFNHVRDPRRLEMLAEVSFGELAERFLTSLALIWTQLRHHCD